MGVQIRADDLFEMGRMGSRADSSRRYPCLSVDNRHPSRVFVIGIVGPGFQASLARKARLRLSFSRIGEPTQPEAGTRRRGGQTFA